tara:strand:- start:79239 stop:79472 length:234 start_codon:yes stop_codon:yes gene_type:complete
MSYMEYKEVKVPDNVREKLDAMQQANDPTNPPTLGSAGFFEWLNTLAKDEGWSAVWSGFNFPYLVLEREVVLEKSEK